jgi:hypothetical protein
MITQSGAKITSVKGGCKGFDGDVETQEASRSCPVYVKKGTLKINGKTDKNLAFAA